MAPGNSSAHVASMSIVAGQGQSGVVGTELPNALIVQVLDSAGAPVAGQIVNFRVTAGGGSMFAGVGLTSATGRAVDRWTLGTSTQDSQRVEARAIDPNTGERLTFAVFQATALAAPPQAVSKIAGDTQSAPNGTPLADSLVVKVVDRYDNPVSGVTVNWTVVVGGGSIPSSSITDAAGLARARWTLGPTGADTVRATVTALPPLTFSAIAYDVVHYSAVSASGYAACATSAAGMGYCWGDNSEALLGNLLPGEGCIDSQSCRMRPSPVRGGLTFSSIVVGSETTCGIATGGAGYCWGRNVGGALGAGSWNAADTAFVPRLVAGGLTLSSIGSTSFEGCALTAAGAAYCWGRDLDGGLGRGIRKDSSNVPVPVSGALTFRSISPARTGEYVCGVTTDDAGYCWGWGRYGNLGVGEILDTLIDTLQGAIDTTIQISDSAHKSVPWPVAGGLKFSMITTGGGFACGLTVDGVPYCWGSRLTEPFGFDWSPVLVNATLTFSTITAGAFHVCALAATGEAYCWGGAHFGATEGEGGSALGDGTTEDRATPVPVAGGHLFTSISAGLGYTCGVTTGRELYCWGANPMGELGNGTTTPSTVPVQVTHP